MAHKTSSHLAGHTVKIKHSNSMISDKEFLVEDWWDRIAKKSWTKCDTNPACFNYKLRATSSNLPEDDEVLYGKIGPFGYLVHISEIESI